MATRSRLLPQRPLTVFPPEALMGAVRRVTAKAASGTWSAEIAGVVADELLELLGADASAVFRIDGDEIVVVGSASAEGQRVFLVGARFPMERQMVAARI